MLKKGERALERVLTIRLTVLVIGAAVQDRNAAAYFQLQDAVNSRSKQWFVFLLQCLCYCHALPLSSRNKTSYQNKAGYISSRERTPTTLPDRDGRLFARERE